MSRNKYEYLLHVWGGFFNKENILKHELKNGYFWFETESDRKTFLDNYRKTEKELNCGPIAYCFWEGEYVRYESIVFATLLHNNTAFPIEYNFGFGYPIETAEYMFFDGNYSCDCNRVLLINNKFGDILDEDIDCGNTIKLISLDVRRVKCCNFE